MMKLTSGLIRRLGETFTQMWVKNYDDDGDDDYDDDDHGHHGNNDDHDNWAMIINIMIMRRSCILFTKLQVFIVILKALSDSQEI